MSDLLRLLNQYRKEVVSICAQYSVLGEDILTDGSEYLAARDAIFKYVDSLVVTDNSGVIDRLQRENLQLREILREYELDKRLRKLARDLNYTLGDPS